MPRGSTLFRRCGRFSCSRRFRIALLRHEPQIRPTEAADVWEHGGEIRARYAKPRSERRAVLVYGGRRYPSAAGTRSAVRVVGTIGRQGRENGAVRSGYAVKVTAANCAAHDELVRRPGMIGSESSVRNEGSGEIRQGKRGDLRSHPEGHGGVVKRLHGAADLGEQVRVRSARRNAAGDLAVVRVEAAERTKENLPLHAQGAS